MKKELLFLLQKIKPKWVQILIGLSCSIIIVLANSVHIPLLTSFINQFDYWIYDQAVQLNWRPHPVLPQVVIIDIDNKSMQQEGQWPWPRNKMADLINKLKQYGVVTIGTDIVMDAPQTNDALSLKEKLQQLTPKLTPLQKQLPLLLNEIAPQVDNDQIFANALLGHNVVLGYLFHDDKQIKVGLLPSPLTTPEGLPLSSDNLSLYEFDGYNGCLKLFVKASTQAGSVTHVPDLDGTVRHGLLLDSYHNELYSGLALAIAMNYLLIDHLTLKTHHNKLYGIQMGGVFIPTNSFGQILIPFWGRTRSLNYYSATDILRKKINPHALQGSIAIIGSTMILLGDLHSSPIAPLFPGVEMVGNMVQGIVSQQLLSQYDWQSTQAKLYLLLFGLFFAVLFSFLSVYVLLMIAISSILGMIAVFMLLFVSGNFYLPLAPVLTLFMLLTICNYVYLFIMEKRQKSKINQLFGQYVPEAYVKELIKCPEQYTMDGQEQNMTAFFVDIRNFTQVSELMGASHVKRLLNSFFTPITELIFNHRGTIDKYVGDMIVAFWGAPIADKDHAGHAILCSLDVVKQLPEINAKLLEADLPEVSIGIGLATGLMNVGDMGSEFRRAYTVIGDVVNLASRLQALTKFYQLTVLVSDGTRAGQDQFIWRVVDKITVKGRTKELTIYQPLGRVEEVSEELFMELGEYQQALEEYYAQNWFSAEKQFEQLKFKYPNVYLYKMYWERIQSFKKNPPSEHWNGIYMHRHK